MPRFKQEIKYNVNLYAVYNYNNKIKNIKFCMEKIMEICMENYTSYIQNLLLHFKTQHE